MPGVPQHAAAIQSLAESVRGNLILYSGYNQHWMAPGRFGTEPFWGLYGDAPSGR